LLFQPSSWKAEILRHPYDSASGTIILGILLTVVLVASLRLWMAV
jgi:hypothetical protein